jgi:hypothetical protein
MSQSLLRQRHTARNIIWVRARSSLISFHNSSARLKGERGCTPRLITDAPASPPQISFANSASLRSGKKSGAEGKKRRGTTKRRTMRADNKNKVPRGHRIVSSSSRIYSAQGLPCPWHCVYFIIRTRTCFSSSISGGIAVIITALHAQNALNEFIHSPRK